MIEVTQETRADWCVVQVRGRADSQAADQLEAALCAALEHNPKVAADFSRLDYISSCGLRAVLQAARAAEARKAQFALCSLSAPVQKVFDISGMHHLLTIQQELPC